MSTQAQVVASFGADLLADKLKCSLVCMPRYGVEHQQAAANKRAFEQAVKNAHAAKVSAANESLAAAAGKTAAETLTLMSADGATNAVEG